MRLRLVTALALCLAAAPALADPADGLGSVPAAMYREAQRLEAEGKFEEAAVRYRAVFRHEPTFKQAVLDLGRMREAQEDWHGAEAAYLLAPSSADCAEALGKLYLAREDPDQALRTFRMLKDLQPEEPEPRRLEILALAVTDPQKAADAYWLFLDYPGVDLSTPGAVAAAVAVSDGLVAVRLGEEAYAFLEALIEVDPEVEQADEIRTRVERLRVEESARRLMRAAEVPLTPEQQVRRVAAQELLRSGHTAAATEAADALAAAAPRSPQAWSLVADVALARDDIHTADDALQRAELLAPLDASYPARLGDLLADRYGGRYDAEAAAYYGRALRLDPSWIVLWYRKGRVELRAGSSERAAASLRRYLDRAPTGPHAAAATEALAGLELERPPPPEVEAMQACPTSLSDEACFHYYVALAYMGQAPRERDSDEPEDGDEVGDEAGAALAELALVLEEAPDFTPALNLDASIRLQAHGDRAGAIARYEQSLLADPDQDLPLILLWELYRAEGDGDAADEALKRALARDLPEAHFVVARESAGRWSLIEARRHLDRYLAVRTGGPYYDQARELDAQLDRRLHAVQISGAAAVAGVLLALPGLWWWRRSGVGVETLLARSPTAYAEVARIGSAIRHEVLKHNITVLPAVADALEDHDLEPARWAADKLFGERGAVARFREHVRALELLGRLHGVHLNLRHRDPTFGPLIEAMDGLARLRKDLQTGAGRGLASQLRSLSDSLNRRGYRALGRLLQRVCLLSFDDELVADAWQAVVSEPAFRNAPLPALTVEVPEGVLLLRIFRGDLEDILANVLRNGLGATHEAGASRMGVRVVAEADPITGLERVAIRVCDDAPRKVTTQMIRGRYIERGLGLTVDLISRSGGSIHVEREPGWSKAVVVRLPRAEAPELEE